MFLVAKKAGALSSSLLKKLLKELPKARSNSYSPYSKFRVGAVLLDSRGKIYTGANVENVTFGATVCAERTAFLKAVSSGSKKFKAIAIMAPQIRGSKTPPCGLCLQTMAEFCKPDFLIYLVNPEGQHEAHRLGDLLPLSFGPDSLD